MEIPAALIEEIRGGRVVLFLGSGASKGALNGHGEIPPTGKGLGDLLSDKFLGGRYKDFPLTQIAELAISETDLRTVQEFIKDVFELFEPSSTHKLIGSFLWHGLATTNYDLLIEKGYEQNPQSLQAPVPFVEDGDRVDDLMRDSNSIKLLKLHGCIRRIANPECPLILTTDQYIEYHKGRRRIFNHLFDWAHEHSIVFIGHSLQDIDIRTLLLEVISAIGPQRPRYYAVAPDVDDANTRLWESKRVTFLKGTFDEFLTSLNSLISVDSRVATSLPTLSEIPITNRFKSKDLSISYACRQFLTSDVEYVPSITKFKVINSSDFYKGLNPGWSAIEKNLDVRRNLADTIMVDHFLITEAERPKKPELILIKAHAGAGKSVMLRRIAWDAAREYGQLCLYVNPFGIINTAAIQELLSLCDERIYLFVDNALDRIRELQSLISGIGDQGNRLTVITAERTNEWNESGSLLAPFITAEYELGYLSTKEVDDLIALLEKHRALGTLEGVNADERKHAFEERAGRQLLVALHEATLGRSFEDIIEDEFRNITPPEAQSIYLTICILNRLNVSVRAGLIARMHGVPFDEFKQRLFLPLEHVVISEENPITRDYMYQARHPSIAAIVFERVLDNHEKRFDNYLRCFKELNIDYASDRRAFRHMIRARSLHALFPNYAMVKKIFEEAEVIGGEDYYLYQQKAIYERIRPDGNLHESGDYLAKASQLAPYDLSIKHSLAEHYFELAERARTNLERNKYLDDAYRLAMTLKSRMTGSSHGYHTLAKIYLAKFTDCASMPETSGQQSMIEDLLAQLETCLSDGLQEFPGDSYLLDAESKLGVILRDSKRVIDALTKAFDANPRNGYIAIRLTSFCLQKNEPESQVEAEKILKRALDANASNRKLHYAYAKLLLENPKAANDVLLYYLQRSFAPGDKNYDAQILYGRQLFIMNELPRSKEFFRQLMNSARVGTSVRYALRYPLIETFWGRIVKIESNYMFIAREGINDWIFVGRDSIDETIRNLARVGLRASFKIAFTFGGPSAFDLKLA